MIWLDIAKGLCMVMVVYGHACGEFDWINQWICSFFMGLFFISSGYTYHYSDNWPMKNLRAIFIPFLLWGIIGLAFTILKNAVIHDLDNINIQEKIYKTLTGIQNDNYPLWFLVAFFVSKSVYGLINKVITSRIFSSHRGLAIVIEVAAVILIASAGYVYSTLKPFGHSILRFDTGLIMLPFFTVGRYSHQLLARVLTTRSKKVIGFALLLGVNIVTGSLLNGLVSVNSNEYGNIALFFVSTISGTWAVFLLCFIIERIPIINKFLSHIGTNSLIVLCCHSFFLLLIGVISIRFCPQLREYPLMVTILCLMLIYPSLPYLDKLTKTVQNVGKK